MLNVAGVGLPVRSRAVALTPAPDRAHEPFLLSPAGVSRFESQISSDVVTDPAPPSDGEVLFECETSWSMQRDGEAGYRLSLRGGDAGEVHTVARSNPDTTEVVIHLNERMFEREGEAARLLNPMYYPLDQLLLMNHLSSRGGMIVHAAGVDLRGTGLVFPGVSGAGKSTICRLLSDAGLGDSLLSDDRIILRQAPDGDGIDAWGTPWPGDARVARNARVPLAAVLFLTQAAVSRLSPLEPGAAMRMLMPVVSSPWYDAERLQGVLATCERLVTSYPCYELQFRPDQSLIDLLFDRFGAA